MNYQDILSKAWKITLNHKYLWILGFCAGLFLGNDIDNVGTNIISGGSWIFQNMENILNSQGTMVILTLIASLIFWVIGTLARIALIHEVTAVDARYSKPIASIKSLFQFALQHVIPTKREPGHSLVRPNGRRQFGPSPFVSVANGWHHAPAPR